MSHRLRAAVFASLVVGVFIAGTIGYTFIEGWSLFDAAYMTVISLTTTGYSETHPLSPEGRTFTMILLLVGAGLITYGIGEIVKLQLTDPDGRRRRKMREKIAQLKDHTVVCGYGRMGKVVCHELDLKDHPFVILERHPERLEELKMTPYLWIEGDASDDNDMIEANIESAKVIVVALDKDADALYALVGAKNINPSIYTICRANTEAAKNRLHRLGANRVVLPIMASAQKVARAALHPDMAELLDSDDDTLLGDSALNLVELPITQKRRFQDVLDFAKKEDVVILGAKLQGHSFTLTPMVKDELNAGDRVVGLCTDDHAEFLLERFLDLNT